jgi:hypothetical protein
MPHEKPIAMLGREQSRIRRSVPDFAGLELLISDPQKR